jgi:hypothetical protein
MIGGHRNKARRGAFRIRLPAGYVREESEIRRDPDERVRDAVQLFFACFERLGSAATVARYFEDQRLAFPHRDGWGSVSVAVSWRALSVSRRAAVPHNARALARGGGDGGLGHPEADEAPFVYDVRGLIAGDYADAGHWSRAGPLVVGRVKRPIGVRPTKFAESLALGQSEAVNRGIRDCDAMIEIHRVSVIVPSLDPTVYERAAVRCSNCGAIPRPRVAF